MGASVSRIRREVHDGCRKEMDVWTGSWKEEKIVVGESAAMGYLGPSAVVTLKGRILYRKHALII